MKQRIFDLILKLMFLVGSFIYIPMLISRSSWYVGVIVGFVYYWWLFPLFAADLFRNYEQQILTFLFMRQHIFKSIFGRHKFHSWEKMCLDAWALTLSDEGQEILKDQLSRRKYLFTWGYSSIFRRVFGFRSIRKFGCEEELVKVATVIIPLNERHCTQCKIYLGKGELHSFWFPRDMKKLMRKFHLSPDDLKIEQVITHVKI